ncbi:MAG: DUF4384 domain-containing protein [Desulfomonile tiedjei]|nr:DUF4384 domain-containing protein [Desulfomonile tiedjei]
MSTPLCRRIATLATIVGFSVLTFSPALGAASDLPKDAAALLNIGKTGPKAIALSIRTDKPEDHAFKPGDSLVLNLKTAKEAYLSAIYVSSTGDAVVLLPNNENPNALVPADKEFTLFGNESCIKVKISDKMKEGQIVFYVASKPLRLEPLRPAEGQPCVQISHSDTKDLQLLGEKLEGLAKDEGFNRVVMRLKTTSEAGLSLKLMGLPTAVKSEKPETITGVQGARPEKGKPE